MTGQIDSTARSDIKAGAQAMAPILISILPFALITGVVAVRLGLSPWQVSYGSLLIFAGTSQIAAMELFAHGASLLVILVTIFSINLRLVMYSASMAPHFRGIRPGAKALVAYLLTDQAFMIGLYGFEQRPSRGQRLRFYMGAALPLWTFWQIAVFVGALAGARLPDNWGLEFAVPLTFLALLVPVIIDRATIAAALVASTVALIAHALPWNIGLMLGALSGVATGVVVSRLSASNV